MITSDQETTALRSQPHNTKLWLSIYQPDIVLACRLNNASIAKGDRIIAYDGVTSGSYQLIQSGMTMWVGTSPGGAEKGKIRVRSATSNEIVVAENSHINWADDDYLSVVSFFEINAIFPRITSTGTTTYWYKDYDIEYTNQNSVLGSFVCMGSHYAGFIENTGYANVYYTSSGTFNLKGEALSYFWFFEGGNPTGSTSAVPGFVQYNTPGHYTTRVLVSGTSSADLSYRHISIYDRPENGTNVPILEWSMQELSGGRDQGGYKTSIRLHENVPESKLREGSLVVIFADDWYGGTKQSIGGNSQGRETIVFAGYILDGSIKYNYRDSYVEFDVASPTEMMKLAEGFSISVQDSRSPDTEASTNPDIPSGWVVVLDLNVRRALYHYLKWHSTVLLCNDFAFVGYDYPIQYFDADRSSLYDAINTLTAGTIPGKVVSDRQGKIWAENDIFLDISYAHSALPITKQDWMGDPILDDIQINKVSFIEAGGIAYSATATGSSSTPYLSAAPGSAPSYRGKVERLQGLSLLDQNQLNTLVGNLYAYRNSRYPGLELNLAGNYRNFDIAPQEIVPITIVPGDTVRGIFFVDKSFFVKDYRLSYEPNKESLITSLSLGEIPVGVAGDTMVIPPIPPTEGDGGYSIPPINIPPIKIPPIIIPASGLNFIAPMAAARPPYSTEWYVTDMEIESPGASVARFGGRYIPGKGNATYGTQDCSVVATFKSGSAGTLTIYPIIFVFALSSTTFTLQGNISIMVASCAETGLTKSITLDVTPTVQGGSVNCLTAAAVSTTIGIYDYVTLEFIRYPSLESGASTSNISFLGWSLAYT